MLAMRAWRRCPFRSGEASGEGRCSYDPLSGRGIGGPCRGDGLTDEKQKPDPNADRKAAFLKAFEDTGSVVDSAKRIGANRASTWKWRQKDPEFQRKFDEIKERKVDTLEASAFDRACHGWLEPVFFQGAQCGNIRRYSTGLTIFMLKNLRPSIYLRELDVHDLAEAVSAINRAHKEMQDSVPRFGVDLDPATPQIEEDTSGNGSANGDGTGGGDA